MKNKRSTGQFHFRAVSRIACLATILFISFDHVSKDPFPVGASSNNTLQQLKRDIIAIPAALIGLIKVRHLMATSCPPICATRAQEKPSPVNQTEH